LSHLALGFLDRELPSGNRGDHQNRVTIHGKIIMETSMADPGRIGIDVGEKLPLEDAVAWAVRHGVRIIDVQLDGGDNAFTRIDSARATRIRDLCGRNGILLGLHTSSAVNVAELAPLVGDAVEAYLKAYVDAAAMLGAGWIVVHAGYHFTSDVTRRMAAGLDRLRRVVAYAETKNTRLLLENLNKEPPDAEVHYLAHTLDEWRWYYEKIQSPAFALSFTANHAHLVPEGVEGFLAAISLDRVAEVRLADCFRNGKEEHLPPGQGDFDFPGLFRELDARGYQGHYTNAFGSLDDMLLARTKFATMP
jgi:sugar phosphate isomerase/epimerase